MNKTVVIWMGIVVAFALRSFVRPSYGVALYLLTFLVAPREWWWGDLVEGYRWSFYSGVLLLASLVLIPSEESSERERPLSSNAVVILLLMAVNATFVHFLFAVNAEASSGWLIFRLKFILLFFMIQYAIRDEKDYQIVAMTIALSMGYMGYEATINERGSFSGGRLEGLGAAGVTSSNQLGSLLITGLPLAVTLLFTQTSTWMKAVVLVSCGLTFNVVLMCNSRGAFLGLLLGGVVFLIMAWKLAGKQSRQVIGLAAVATFLLLGDPAILSRFMTTFTSGGQRDSSAQSRIIFWTAASGMVRDYPLGSGGNSFSEGRGWRYMPRNVGALGNGDQVGDTRAIHNGFLTEAVDWGIQGFLLMLLFLGAVWRTLRRGRRLAIAAGDTRAVIVFACIATSLVAWMVSSVFGDYLNDEWGFWTAALAYSYLRVRMFASTAVDTSRDAVSDVRSAPWPATMPHGVAR